MGDTPWTSADVDTVYRLYSMSSRFNLDTNTVVQTLFLFVVFVRENKILLRYVRHKIYSVHYNQSAQHITNCNFLNVNVSMSNKIESNTSVEFCIISVNMRFAHFSNCCHNIHGFVWQRFRALMFYCGDSLTIRI
jgi:hypothetical protein